MEIIALGEGFGVGMIRGWEHEWSKEYGGSLVVWSADEDTAAHVITNRGVFVELVDGSGKVIVDGGDGEWLYVPIGKDKRALRYKMLADPELSSADIEAARQTVTRCLVSDRPYSLNLPDDLVGVIAWMQGKLEEIPEACRDDATFRFDTSYGYGESYPNIEIEYREKETDEEVVRRLKIERERDRKKEIAERAKYEALKAKFGQGRRSG